MKTVSNTLMPEAPPAPTWEQLKADGLVVIDDEMQKVAVYPGGGECVVIMTQWFSDRTPSFTSFDASVVPALIDALRKAQAQTIECWNEIEARMRASGNLWTGE